MLFISFDHSTSLKPFHAVANVILLELLLGH